MSIAPEPLANVRLLVLQRAIAALIMTHPDPATFAKTFRSISGIAQIDHLLLPGADPEWQQEAVNFARELVELADAEVAFRQTPTGHED